MNTFNPSNFYLGVIEFFAVLLPGILLSYTLLPLIDEYAINKLIISPPNDFSAVAMFLIMAYILGNLLMAIGSTLLDEKLYDSYRKKRLTRFGDIIYKAAESIKNEFIPTTYINNLYKEENTSAQNEFAEKIKKYNEKNRQNEVSSPTIFSPKFTWASWQEFQNDMIRAENSKKKDWKWFNHLLSSDPKPNFYAKEVVNVFKWSQAYFRFQNPDALAEIKRLEADSKFFRSLTVTLPIILLVFIIQIISENLYSSLSAWVLVILSLLLIIPSFRRYADFRYKSSEKAYEFIIIIYYPKIKSDIIEEVRKVQ